MSNISVFNIRSSNHRQLAVLGVICLIIPWEEFINTEQSCNTSFLRKELHNFSHWCGIWKTSSNMHHQNLMQFCFTKLINAVALYLKQPHPGRITEICISEWKIYYHYMAHSIFKIKFKPDMFCSMGN